MKKVLLAIVSVVLLNACTFTSTNAKGDGNADERRELKGFEKIVVQGSMDVKYKQGDKCSVLVKARKSDLQSVVTRVEGNKLVVSMQGTNKVLNFGWTDGDDVTVYVTSPDLIGVEVNGSGDFKCKQHLDSDNLEVSLNGSGDIDLYDVICDRIKVSVVGSGEVKINKIISQRSDVSLVGSGEVKMNQEQVKMTLLELKGSGDIKLNCQDCGMVESRLFGSGDITLTGHVAAHKSVKRGSGDLETDNLIIGEK